MDIIRNQDRLVEVIEDAAMVTVHGTMTALDHDGQETTYHLDIEPETFPVTDSITPAALVAYFRSALDHAERQLAEQS